jgi:hypothetical protein
MSGYVWARTPEGALFVVLVTEGKGFVPGVEGAIDLHEIAILEPVQWPAQTTPPSQNLAPPKPGALAAAAALGCRILPFAANG